MSSTAIKRTTVAALAGAAILGTVVAPTASARPVDQPAIRATGDASLNSPPPPSSIARSAADEYENLRSTAVAPGPRNPQGPQRATASDGFDLPSAAIGAAAVTGLVIGLLAAGGLVRGRRPQARPHSAIGA